MQSPSISYDSVIYTLTISGSGELQQQSSNVEAIHIILSGFTRLGDHCFSYYTLLETIILPDTLLYIGNNAFAGTKIRELTLPSSVNELSPLQPFDNYFWLNRITVHKDNPYFCDVDGVLYSKNKKILWYYPGNRTETICKVPYGVTEVKTAAFANSYSRKIIIIPPTVRKIGDWFGLGSVALEAVIIQQCLSKINIDKSNLFNETELSESIIQYEEKCIIPITCKRVKTRSDRVYITIYSISMFLSIN